MVDTAIGGMKFKATIYEVERPVSFLIVFLSQKVVKYPFLWGWVDPRAVHSLGEKKSSFDC